ncbi:MAG TPA: lipopolysaccharide biosynthesis protein [Caulobacteraceae bacterium]|nr:lipopolysaccharide biosynthesis protein [Caulobacteraceae bacterium]
MFWRGVLGYLPVNVVQGVVGLLAIVTFTRLLTPEQYGAYALGFSAMSLGHTICFTWLEAAMARFYATEAQGPKLADHFATLYRTWAAMAVVFPVLAGLALWLWPTTPAVKAAMAAGLASILVRSLAKLAQERRRAAGDVRGAARLDMAQSAGGFALGAALIATGLGGAAPLAGLGVIAAACIVFVLPTELKGLKGGRFEASRARAYAAYGLPVSASLILALALATTDRFLLGAYLNEAAVGVYHAGYSLANRTLDVMFIWLGMAGGPAMVMALERGGKAALAEAAREQAEVMVALTLPAAAGLALVARPLADVMVGPALRAGAAEVTPWIAASAFFAGVTTYYWHQAFTLARRTPLLLAAMALPALANVVLNLVLIPRYGLDGALWATTASYALGLAASMGLGRRALPLPFPTGTFLGAALATLAMTLVVLRLPSWGGIAELALKAGCGGLVYGLVAGALDVGGLRAKALRLIAVRLQPRAA